MRESSGWPTGRSGTPAIGPVADGYAILGYARDPARLSADVAAYRSALGESGRLRVTLRPGLPDTPSAANLAEKLRLVATADAVDFYSYGLFPLPVLDRIPEVLSPLRSRSAGS